MLSTNIDAKFQVYALYERNVKMLIFLLSLCVIEVGAMVILAVLTIDHLESWSFVIFLENKAYCTTDLPLVSTSTGCFYNGVLGLSALFWVPGLIYEPILFVLVAYKAWPAKRQGLRTPLTSRIARDRYVSSS